MAVNPSLVRAREYNIYYTHTHRRTKRAENIIKKKPREKVGRRSRVVVEVENMAARIIIVYAGVNGKRIGTRVAFEKRIYVYK